MRRAPNGLMTTSDVVFVLAQRGVRTTRDTLSRITPMVLDEASIRDGDGKRRIYTPAHVDVLEFAFRIHERLRIEFEEIGACLRQPEMAEQLRAQVEQQLDYLEELQRAGASLAATA